ncbi:MAG: hypothetical protein ACRCYO_07880 [Bacteroidia bacterium]
MYKNLFAASALLASLFFCSCSNETAAPKTDSIAEKKFTPTNAQRDTMQQRLYNECLGAMPESQASAQVADAFCSCVTDSVTKRFGEENFRKMERDLPYEKMADTIQDIAKHCMVKSGLNQ